VNHERLLDQNVQPTPEDMARHIGGKPRELWRSLTEYLSLHYRHVPELDFGGRKYGWSIRYRRGGKTLVTLFPKRGAFTALVVLGRKEVEKAEGTLDKMSAGGRRLFQDTDQLHDGRWLWIRPSSMADVESIKLLVNAKRQPKLPGQSA
jgi:hypothetical protein